MNANTLYNANNKPGNLNLMLPNPAAHCPRRRKFIGAEKCRAPTQWICWTFLSISRNNDQG
ncbi:hypothetical protein, partial [Enterobacter hormaechei]|uniref:hypothetical protein n=1 Tax=Enterobacter hormaechei TaxID=158836 RepID=UPI0019544F78